MMSEQQNRRQCVQCKYDLAGLDDRAVCSECGTPVVLSVIFRNSPRMVKVEERLIRREASYLRGRIGALGMAVVAFLSVFMLVYVMSIMSSPGDGEAHGMFIMLAGGQVWFWGALAYSAHARYQHAKCARLYRRYLTDQASSDGRAATAGKPAR